MPFKRPHFNPTPLYPVAAIVLAATIFTVDTITELEIAIPVFYTAVILIAARFCNRLGILLTGLACIGLIFVSDLLTPDSSLAGVINTAISILAIAATAALVLRVKANEQEAYEARAQLSHVARVTTLGELAASIAHEVNQPLTATVINSNASLRWLSAEPPNLAEARQAIENIRRDTERAAGVVARVRALAKRAPMPKSPLDINEVIGEILMLSASEIRQHQIALSVDLRPGLGRVTGDSVQLGQVILNLIVNAIDAMETNPPGERQLTIRSGDGAGGVVVEVSDTGPGLDADAVKHLFNAFYTTKTSGLGLGLTISRTIIESHGGQISATPREPHGATFTFTLPAIRNGA